MEHRHGLSMALTSKGNRTLLSHVLAHRLLQTLLPFVSGSVRRLSTLIMLLFVITIWDTVNEFSGSGLDVRATRLIARRTGRFLLQGAVHAFMAAVLLRMARQNALEGDAEPEPEDRELRQVVESVRTGKGQAVVAADRCRKAALPEELDKGLDDRLLAGRFKGFTAQDHARGLIGDGQRVTVASVTGLELALEIGAPEVVGQDRL